MLKTNLNNIETDPKDSSKLLPKSNGVYIFKNKDEQIVYVGKAKNLKSRVSSYFTSKETRAIRIKNEIHSIDFGCWSRAGLMKFSLDWFFKSHSGQQK